ncbi:hypothetical protein FA727_13950 [Robertmurraya kyonggiensis]|uniref:Uncharacterized protein n=1 Tax=Robertmurraya kyonggiensis TaxID=1037680 RepID=A0A4U1D2K7_9BACI|nr:hypothetical protein FA727_13950 [Robertmurraya kyonggiensis]
MLFLVTACSQSGEEDTEKISGVISKGQVLGYEYETAIEGSSFLWKVGHKQDSLYIKESDSNKEILEDFMVAVNKGTSVLVTLMISLGYIVIIAITTFILFKKNRKIIKASSGILIAFSVIAMFIAFESATDFNRILHDAEYYFLVLKNI